MKAIYLLLFFIGLIIPESTNAQTRLVALIDGAKATDSLWASVPTFWYQEPESQSNMVLTGDRRYEQTLPINSPRLIYLHFRQDWIKLYVEPKKDLTIQFNADSLINTLHFEGALAEQNTRFQELGLTTFSMAPHPWTGSPTSATAIATKLLKEKRIQLSQIDRLKQQPIYSKSFFNLVEGEIRYKPILELANLLVFGIRGSNRQVSNQALKLAQDNEAYSDDRFLLSDIYYSTVNRTDIGLSAFCGQDTACEQKHTLQLLKADNNQQLQQKYSQYGQLYAEINRAPFLLKDRTLEKVMAGWIHSFKDDYLYLRPAYEEFIRRYPKSAYRLSLEKELRPFFAFEKQSKQGGKISFTPTDKEIKTMADLIKPHRGRAVYVDFWGTWCMPCRAEMPYSAQLKALYKDEPIDFIYVAQENGTEQSRIDRWKATIERLNITGEHFLMTPAFEASLKAQDLAVNRYPTYIIYDRSGKLVKFDAARPSQIEVVKGQLSQALK
jgi:thiol-disulfide isomerase/thioredoxin